MKKNRWLFIFIPVIYSLLFTLVIFLEFHQLFFGSIVLFFLGSFLGLLLMLADEEYLYRYYLIPKQTKKLITRSLLFIITLLPLGIFLATSTGSILGVASFLSIITVLMIEMLTLKNKPKLFQQRFLSQLKRTITKKDTRSFSLVFTILVFVFIILIFFLS